MRAVLDTCILYAALRSSSGASFQLLELLPKKRFQPVVSTPVYFEYEEVLLRPGQFPHLTEGDIRDFLDYVANACEPVRVDFLWRPFLPDPDDDLILELAVAAQARSIVTHNLRDFAGVEKFGVRAVTPGHFYKEIRP